MLAVFTRTRVIAYFPCKMYSATAHIHVLPCYTHVLLLYTCTQLLYTCPHLLYTWVCPRLCIHMYVYSPAQGAVQAPGGQPQQRHRRYSRLRQSRGALRRAPGCTGLPAAGPCAYIRLALPMPVCRSVNKAGEAINPHTVDSLAIPRASIKWI